MRKKLDIELIYKYFQSVSGLNYRVLQLHSIQSLEIFTAKESHLVKKPYSKRRCASEFAAVYGV